MSTVQARHVLRATVIGACLATPIVTTAQEHPRPPAASPAGPPVVRQLSPQESLAMARQRAIADSVRRRQQERMDSTLRARRLEAARGPAPRQSPIFGEPPFYGYTWVFYGDIVAGTAVGLASLLIRQRSSNATARRWWAGAGLILGAIGGACVFIPFFFLTGLIWFGNPPSALTLFGLTLAVMVLTGLWVAFASARG